MHAEIKKIESNIPYCICISNYGVPQQIIRKRDIADVFNWLDRTSRYTAFTYAFKDNT